MWLERFEAFCCHVTHVQFSSVRSICDHHSHIQRNDNEPPSSPFPGNIFMFTHRQPTKPTVCLCSQHQKVCRNFARKVSVIECSIIESIYSRFCLHGLELGHVVAGDVALELGGVGPGEPPLALRVVDDVEMLARFHNRFSQSRRRPLLGPSPG